MYINLPLNLIIRKEYDSLIFTLKGSCTDSFSYELISSGKTSINEIGRTIIIEETVNSPDIIDADADVALLDKELLPYPLTVRNFSLATGSYH
jgi:hypothetical protein